MITHSDSIGKLAEALSKAQGEIRNAVKDANNPYFQSKYADLASVTEACRAPLASNGLSISQLPITRDGKLVLVYMLMHSSGEFLMGDLQMNPTKTDPQGIGSAITYARRYTLAALVGVATEDDDGNAASDKKVDNVDVSKKPISFKRSDTTDFSRPATFYDESKKESVAPNGGTAGNRSAFVQKGESAPAAATDLEESLKASIEAQYITIEQQNEFHGTCRQKTAARNKNKADDLTYQWLMDNHYINSHGEPSASMIPVKDWPNAMNMATRWISVQ